MSKEKVLKNATLCFPIRSGEVALGRKLKHIGVGKLNGCGGGIEEGENPLDAMIRELHEEWDVTAKPADFEKVAIIDFDNTTIEGIDFICRVHVYLLRRWSGELRSTGEMDVPTWYPLDDLPLDEMMPADRVWFPLIMDGCKIEGRAKYGPHQQELLAPMKIDFVDSFPDE